jgi:site-specific recombinase XerC
MTPKRTPENEQAKRRYLQYLRDARGRDENSIDQVAKSIERFDDYNRRHDYRKFHIEQARGFKAHLMEQRNARTGEPLSASTINSTLGMLKAFFLWLAGEPDYRARIKYADAEYFNAPESLARVATARRHKACPTLEQIRIVLKAMPASTEIERRNQALVAFTILTDARDRAIVSFRLKHIDIEHELLEQDARQVHTKGSPPGFSPSAPTFKKSWSIGWHFCEPKGALARKTRSFPSRASKRARTFNFARTAWIARHGRTPIRFARSSRRHSRGSACPISIPIVSAIRSSSSRMTSDSTPRNSKRGRKISGMKNA